MPASAPLFARHGTLEADTVATVTVDVDSIVIMIKNRGTTDPVWFTINGDTPTVEGDDVGVVLAGDVAEISSANPGTEDVVRLLSEGTPDYSVEAYRP